MTNRRDVMKSAVLALGGTAVSVTSKAERPRRGRSADLGDGTYLNPVLSGDYADPTVVSVTTGYESTQRPRACG